MMSQRTLEGRPAEDEDVAAMKAQEVAVCDRADLVLYPAAEEAALMGELINPAVSARAIAAYRFTADELAAARADVVVRPLEDGPLRLLFVGGFAHSPNADAIIWFCREVLPQLSTGHRPLQLSIVGSRAGPDIRALQQPGVEVLGFVSDDELRRLYRQADIVVAPLRYGAGVKGKVIEAMARGVPVVTTDVGAQGIDHADRLLFIGNTAQEIAQAVVAAGNPDDARQRALASIAYVETNYSTQAMLDVLQAGFAPR
jgi:glycosyltransferase involved in cell wall biosynthesis